MGLKKVLAQRGKWFWLSFGTFGGLGGYSLMFKTNSYINVYKFLDSSVIHNFKSHLFNPLEDAAKQARIETYKKQQELHLEALPTQESSDKSVGLYEAGKTIIDTVATGIKEFVKFIVTNLIPSIQELGVEKTTELIQDYAKPMKHLLSRPDVQRLQSSNSRLSQYIKAAKSKEFWQSLPVMNKFYLEFKDQIATLSDDELSEVIDIYLDNPDAMMEKVNLVMRALQDDKDSKSKFTKELMMNFVRSENIDEIKQQIAASKAAGHIVSGVNKLGWAGENEQEQKQFQKKVEQVISSVISGFSGS